MKSVASVSNSSLPALATLRGERVSSADGRRASWDGAQSGPQRFLSNSEITGEESQVNAASKPTGSPPGATGAVEKPNAAALNTEQAARLNAMLETRLRTLRDGLRSLPMANPDNLQEVTAGILAMAEVRAEALATARSLMSPSGDENVVHVTRLSVHYPAQYSTDGLTGKGLELMQAIKRQVKTDFTADLAEYPSWVVEEACIRWRRESKFRPTSAELRGICDEILQPIRAAELEARKAIENAQRKAEFEAHCESERRRRYGLVK